MQIKGFFKDLLLSDESNDHRPYILRPQIVGIIILCLVMLKVSLSLDVFLKTQLVNVKKDITSEKIYQLTNDERLEFNLNGLSYSPVLEQAALKKAQHMLDNDYWAHTSPDGVTPWHWFSAVGYDYEEAGENLAVDFETSDGVMKAWMNSPSHRKNILEPMYSEIGIGIMEGEFQGSGSILVVQLFGTPKAKQIAGSTTKTTGTITVVQKTDTIPPITTLTPPQGTYDKPTIIIFSKSEAATTYLTIDGSMPTISSKKYDAPLKLTESTTFKYFSIDSAGNAEKVKTALYMISPESTTPHEFSVTSPDENSVQNVPEITVFGYGEPYTNVGIYINEELIREKTISQAGFFNVITELKTEGLNKIKVTNGSKSKTVLIVLDTIAPIFIIDDDPTMEYFDDYVDMHLVATAEDTDMASFIAEHESTVVFEKQSDGSYTSTLHIPKTTDNFTIRCIATDKAGNQAVSVFEFTLEEDNAGIMVASDDSETSATGTSGSDIVTSDTAKANTIHLFSSTSVGNMIFKWTMVAVLLFFGVIIGINNWRHKVYNIPLRLHHTGVMFGFIAISIVGILLI